MIFAATRGPNRNLNQGQILAEVLIAVAIVGVIGAVIGTIFFVSARSSEAGKKRSQAVALAVQALETVRGIAQTDYDTSAAVDSGWLHIYCPRANNTQNPPACSGGGLGTKGAEGTGPSYKITQPQTSTFTCATAVPTNPLDLCPGNETINLEEESFTRSIYIENVCRNSAGAITGSTDTNGSTEACAGADTEVDRSTQKITVVITSQNVSAIRAETYVTRWVNTAGASSQTSWDASGIAGPVFDFNTCEANPDNCFSTETFIDNTSTPGSLKLE